MTTPEEWADRLRAAGVTTDQLREVVDAANDLASFAEITGKESAYHRLTFGKGWSSEGKAILAAWFEETIRRQRGDTDEATS